MNMINEILIGLLKYSSENEHRCGPKSILPDDFNLRRDFSKLPKICEAIW